MGWDRLQGLLALASGKAREQWGTLTHDERTIAAARREQFAARIQRRYGVAMAEAERLLAECERNAGDPWFAAGRTYR
ncbi:MAG: general stress protein CsbD [Burkholderiales bacterium]|nr:general stress protein CsbD [Burkholderiales bacterium]